MTTKNLHHRAKPDERLLFRSMGKSHRITAIYTTNEDANRHMAQSGNDDAVIACFGPFIFLANKYSGDQS